jgi:CxxC motif-containing protein
MPELTEEMICITCPMGCTLQVTHAGETLLHVDGNTCPRGKAYVQRELTDPRRMVATTVRVKQGLHPLVPVYTEAPFPKLRIFELLAAIRALEIEAPVAMEQVVLENALGTGINVVASRDMPRVGTVGDRPEQRPA